MADKSDIDEASPWNTPLSGAPKPKTPAEIDATVKSKGVTASPSPAPENDDPEPDRTKFPSPIAYNLAMRKWTQRQTKPAVMNRGVSSK